MNDPVKDPEPLSYFNVCLSHFWFLPWVPVILIRGHLIGGWLLLIAIDAIKIFSEHYDTIDIVLLDLLLPGFSGKEILSELKKINKDTKIVISTGLQMDDTSAPLGNV